MGFIMNKVKIQIIKLGSLPAQFDSQKVSAWNSDIFEIIGHIDHYELRCDSDTDMWRYSDKHISQQLPEMRNEADFLIAILNVPLEDNWYSRRLGYNKIALTFHEIKEFLLVNNIPLENVVLRCLYSYLILYRRSGNKIPNLGEEFKFTHDETRGCIFDMTGIKTDIVYSCHKPIICDECVERIKRDKVSVQTIEVTKKEIRQIQKDLYYQILDFIRKKPIWSLIVYVSSTIILGLISSIIASLII